MPETRTLVPGVARAPALVLDEPMSLWGGIDPATGDIVDAHHPQRGSRVAGVVLVMPSGRGSSSSSTILAEMARAGTAPAAFVLRDTDPILALGAIVARELYGTRIPVIVASDPIATGREVRITATAERTTIELV